MGFSRPPLVVAFELSEKRKAIVADTLAGVSAVVYLTELDEVTRAQALRDAVVLLTFNTSKELRSGGAKARRRTPQGDAELIAKNQVLDFKPAPRLEQVDTEHSKRMQEREHRPRSCDDSTRRCDS